MMSTERPIEFIRRTDPVDFVDSELRSGGPVARRLSETVSWEQGSFLVPIPPRVRQTPLDYHVALPEQVTEAEGLAIQAAMVRWIRDTTVRVGGVCVFEAPFEVARADYLLTWGVPVCYFENSTLLYVDSTMTDPAAEELLRRGAGVPGVGFVAVPGFHLKANRDLAEPDLDAVISDVPAVLVSAFDEEGWIVWERHGHQA
jgi:hypothetical protein